MDKEVKKDVEVPQDTKKPDVTPKDSSVIKEALKRAGGDYSGHRSESLDKVFYAFISIAIIFYVLSGWILLASFYNVPLPGFFKNMVLGLGRILA